MRIPILDEEFNIHEEIEELFIHRFFLVMGQGLITVFLPFYIYELGFSIPIVVSFFIFYYGAYFLVSMPVAKIASVIGYRKTSMLSLPFMLSFYAILRNFESDSLTALYALALLGGLSNSLYWIGMNSELSQDSHSGKQGRETGIFFSISSAAGILSPFLGGLVIADFGFEALFTLTIALLAFSFVPFFFSKERYTGMDVSFSAFFSKSHLIDFALFAFKGVVNIGYKVVWPLYLAIIIADSVDIGSAGSLGALGVTIFSMILGQKVDEGSKDKIMTYGGAVFALSWVAMSFVVTPVQAFVISLINGLFVPTLNIPVMSGVIEKARREDVLGYFAFREIALAFGRMVFLGIFVLLFSMLSQKIWFLVGFTLLALSTLMVIWLGRSYGHIVDRARQK